MTVVWTQVPATHLPGMDVVRKLVMTVGCGQHDPGGGRWGLCEGGC